MNPYIASIPLVVFVILMISMNVYFDTRRKREQKKKLKETFFDVRAQIVKFINKQLKQNGRVYDRTLYYKLKAMEIQYSDIDFDLDVCDGLFTVQLTADGLFTEINGYIEVPSWNKTNNVKYEVI